VSRPVTRRWLPCKVARRPPWSRTWDRLSDWAPCLPAQAGSSKHESWSVVEDRIDGWWNRLCPGNRFSIGCCAPSKLAFTAPEIHLLDQLAKREDPQRLRRTSVPACLVQLARLGGYLARTGDSPPGNKVNWKGLSRLTDIQFSFLIGAKLVGN
jgi:hypothetical protein